MSARVVVSGHAAQRYRERFDPELSHEQSCRRVEELFRSGKAVLSQGRGRTVFEAGELRFVARFDEQLRCFVILTVLPWIELCEPRARSMWSWNRRRGVDPRRRRKVER